MECSVYRDTNLDFQFFSSCVSCVLRKYDFNHKAVIALNQFLEYSRIRRLPLHTDIRYTTTPITCLQSAVLCRHKIRGPTFKYS